MSVIGIDPGLKGGISWFDGKEFYTTVPKFIDVGGFWMLDVVELGKWYEKGIRKLGEPATVFCEAVHSMPHDAKPAAFSFGWVASATAHFFAMHELRLQFVPPQTWQRALLKELKDQVAAEPEFQGKVAKAVQTEAAIRFLKARYPRLNLLATERSKVPHSGLADACCISHFGMLK